MSYHSLKPTQLEILNQIYKYRFVTINLLQASLDLNSYSTLQRKLEVLIERNLVGKDYKPIYHLRHIHAAYYLRPEGLRALAKSDPSIRLTKASYAENSRSRAFIDQYLAVYNSLNLLQRLFPLIKAYTARDLASYRAFPKPTPAAYLVLEQNKQTQRFFLDFIPEGFPNYKINQLIDRYHQFFLEETWSQTEAELPTLLIVTDQPSNLVYLERLISKKQAQIDMVEPNIYLTSLPDLKSAVNHQAAIWIAVGSNIPRLKLADVS